MTTTTETKTYAKPLVSLDVVVGRQCSNGGVSSRHSRVDLYPAETEYFQVDPTVLDQAVKVVYRSYLGIFHVEPVRPPTGIGWMAGGSYVTTSDSRFAEESKRVGGKRFYGAMALHDRQETQEQYDRLSR